MVQRPDVPRSRFSTRHTLKTTFAPDKLIPIFVDEVLPGDDIRAHATVFLRMATPLFPVMDNIHAECFFFFVPNRLVWDNWVKMMGERKAPNDSIDFVVPQTNVANGTDGTGFDEFTVGDYFGLPIKGELPGSVPGNYKTVSALPFRAYNLIWNEWFRSQDLSNPASVQTGDTDGGVAYSILPRAKRHDYFTASLPWPLKGGQEVSIPVGTAAPVKTRSAINTWQGTAEGLIFRDLDGSPIIDNNTALITGGVLGRLTGQSSAQTAQVVPANLYADLSEATGATLNAMRLAIATQHLLERDARGGTRYTELLKNHFGVDPQDSRLQRPEYIGGGRFTLVTQAIAQTSASAYGEAASTPLGDLAGATTGSGRVNFSYSATEHGIVIGLINVYGDITYQRGIHRMWTRQTRYDFYWPTFAFLGEQAVRNDEIWADGSSADEDTFGYQERWAEYRYKPSRITGRFRSNATGSLDTWHLSEDFATRPALNNEFLKQATPIKRVVAAGDLAANQEFLMDSVFDISTTRPLPMRSTPGLTRF